MEYYYTDGRNTFGPVSLEELRTKINPNTPVWHEGMANWEAASSLEELKPLFARPTPPPPPSAPTPPPTPTASQAPKAKISIGLVFMGIIECLWAGFLSLNYLVSIFFDFSYQWGVYQLFREMDLIGDNYKFFDFIVSLPITGFWFFSLIFGLVVFVKSLIRR